jgi:hypothetical protein
VAPTRAATNRRADPQFQRNAAQPNQAKRHAPIAGLEEHSVSGVLPETLAIYTPGNAIAHTSFGSIVKELNAAVAAR